MTISLAVPNVVLILSILMVAMAVPRYMNSADGPLPRGIIFKEPEDNSLVFPEEALPWRSGYLTVNASSKTRMFYAFYEAIEPNMSIAQTPIILWLQGGPGCSSMTGNFYELGPWKISSDLTLYRNRSPWNRKFGVLFIDSPAGSGYSIAEKDEDIPTDENQVAEHLYIALKKFYNSLPEFSNRLLFVAGESYAGKYVPALGHYILMKSKKNSTDNEELGSLGYGGSKLPFVLGGLLIGNGLTDPEIQVQTHANVAYNFGLIDTNQKTYVGELAERVLEFIHKQQWFEAYTARTALLDWIQNVSGIATPLDVRRSVPYHCSPDGHSHGDELKQQPWPRPSAPGKISTTTTQVSDYQHHGEDEIDQPHKKSVLQKVKDKAKKLIKKKKNPVHGRDEYHREEECHRTQWRGLQRDSTRQDPPRRKLKCFLFNANATSET